ncbi:MAG TPA: hypothetical protein VLC46_19070 [Thermoanaerobaculia bacterium]|jgi:hypothetical protein|nr:hypothetical protein [Thermoanaerobaculia bacterium]
MLEYRADQKEATVSGVLERELDGIARAHVEELSEALPGSPRRLRGRPVDEKAYPQMAPMERRWKTVYLRTSASSADSSSLVINHL